MEAIMWSLIGLKALVALFVTVYFFIYMFDN